MADTSIPTVRRVEEVVGLVNSLYYCPQCLEEFDDGISRILHINKKHPTPKARRQR